MVFAGLALLLAAVQGPDTSTFLNEQTARLVSRAQGRHRFQDTLVHDYTAVVRTRVDAGFGRSRFARILPIVAVETAAEVTWARPNDFRVKIVGVRSASTLRGANVESTFSDPWFVPRGLGDSIRFVDQDLPETPALHPLAPSGPSFYRYAIFDSVSIDLPDRRISAIGIRVTPKSRGPSLIAGNLWVDVESAEVVRMEFTYVGDYLWSRPDSSTATDSSKALKDNRRANRILKIDAELEYALHQSRYWMPYRQLVTLTVDIPWFINATIPVRFITTFGEYEINRGVIPQFTIPPEDSTRWVRCRKHQEDSTCAYAREIERHPQKGYTRAALREGGRWELVMPPKDSLAGYPWADQLALQPDPATEQLIRETTTTLAKMQQDLPAEWVGRELTGIAFERFSDLLRFNRVQGPSIGAGVRVASRGFSSLLASGRFGISDKRPTGRLTFRRDAPGGRLDIAAWREVREAEPWTHGESIGNSLNALFAGHDDADYHLTLGGGVSFLGNVGLAQDAELALRFDRVRSMDTRARSSLNDALGGSGVFPFNPAALPGDYLSATIDRRVILYPLDLRFGIEGVRGIGGAASGATAGRGWASARVRFSLGGFGTGLTLRGGTSAGDDIPQLMFRVGGPETVRGYDYGTRSGRSVWAGQVDIALNRSGLVSPVVFTDVGNTTFSGKPLTAVGGGISFFGGFIRFNVSKGLTPKNSLRFDLLFRTAR